MFKEAKTVENVQARNDALSAAIVMDTADRLLQFSSNDRKETNDNARNVETVGTEWGPGSASATEKGD